MSDGRRSRAANQHGVALVTVLWTIAFLTVLAATVAVVARSDLRLARNMAGLAEARHAAEGGVYYAVARLADGSGQWIGNGTTYRAPLPGTRIDIRVQDEAGRIDLNGADEELLRRLFLAAGADAELAGEIADSIMDWRDQDSLRRLHGAEDHEYMAAGREYGPRNGPFTSVEELQMVLPVPVEMFRAVRPALTVYTGSRGVNPVLAPAMALMAVSGVDAAAITEHLAMREQTPGRVVTAGMPPVNRRFVEAVGGHVFEISATATTGNGLVATVSAIVALRLKDAVKPYSILRWSDSVASSPGKAAP